MSLLRRKRYEMLLDACLHLADAIGWPVGRIRRGRRTVVFTKLPDGRLFGDKVRDGSMFEWVEERDGIDGDPNIFALDDIPILGFPIARAVSLDEFLDLVKQRVDAEGYDRAFGLVSAVIRAGDGDRTVYLIEADGGQEEIIGLMEILKRAGLLFIIVPPAMGFKVLAATRVSG